MCKHSPRILALAALLTASVPGPGLAQGTASPSPASLASAPQAPAAAGSTTTICGQPVPPPATLPPADSGPVIYQIAPCFQKQGNVSTVEPQTYLYYIQLKPSLPSQRVWMSFDEKAEETIRADFKRLWATSFLEDLSISTEDYIFPNGVVGKLVTYDMEERVRIRLIDYVGSKKIDRTKIDEQLKERGIELRLDSFLDEGLVRRVEGILRAMMAEQGYTNAEVTHKITPVAGGPKLVNITFNVGEGPKIRIRDVEFVGNSALGDGTLQRKMKENKPKGILSFITGGGTYKEAMFEEDAEKVLEHYRNKGYVRARIGQPEIKVLEDSDDGKTRWIQLRIPVTEGPRYRLGELGFDGNTIVKAEALRPLFKIEKGDWYSDKDVRDGLRKAQEIYGGGGYMEFTGFPDYTFKNDGIEQEPDAALAAQVPEALAVAAPATNGRPLNPTVDVTMRLQEGKQYFVNRIFFTGNSTTRDNVIRREMRLVEGGVFNTESLKYSIRRLNQLGYFKQLEGNDKDMKVDKTPGRDNAVDVTLKVEEQNRNQLTFGAGISQYEGVFGQIGFQTANFLGRGESLTLNIQAGQYTENYQLAFTEPFLFDRNITGGIDLFKRSFQYIGYYTQKSTGGNLVFGFPVADFSRMFLNYSYQRVGMTDLNEYLLDPDCRFRAQGCGVVSPNNISQLGPTVQENLRRNPFLFDAYMIGQNGRRTISKIVPSFVHNTIDNPIFPAEGKRLTMSFDLAGLGGNTAYYKPSLEGIWYRRHLGTRTSFGGRAQFEYIAPYKGTETLPIFEKLVLGGEYSVRGYDLRSIGPSLPGFGGVVVGGNKSVLFNAEYLIQIAGPVRLVLFYDAGQVRDVGQGFALKEDVTELAFPERPFLSDPFAAVSLTDPSAPGLLQTKVVGRTSAFKTSTGAEVRFFMPVLNVPFRLIFAHNPQRTGVLDNNLQPAKKFAFKFAVGSTF